jgi:hypothetical protein
VVRAAQAMLLDVGPPAPQTEPVHG